MCYAGLVSAAGGKLPSVTLRQLRAYKQQHLVRHHGLIAAADAMGHTIATSVASYSAAQEGVQANEMGRFMSSLQKTVIRHASRSNTLVSVPVGGCASYGNPSVSGPTPPVEPACTKIEGCFFCEQFRVHADEEDLRKVLSCQQILMRIRHLQGESEQADRVYGSVLGRVEVLLREIQQAFSPNAFERIKGDVDAGSREREGGQGMSAKLQVEKYFQALQRLIDRGAKISNDTVALEAGSGRGSIKRSRTAYTELIAAIELAAQAQAAKVETDPISVLREEKANLVQLLDGALERELALLSEVYILREEVWQLREQLPHKALVVVHNPQRPRVR